MKKGGRSRNIRSTTLSQILDASPFKDRAIDLLSIDVEGHEKEVLLGLDFERYRPDLILVEIHAQNIDALMASPAHQVLSEKGYIIVSWAYFTVFYRKRM